ncbi:hypothetical protein JTE90_024178 [Oedothorax gibbosus]|uniref:Uncharacterized protein n=1 Tax=Oedothorax gibbosus TaxID=931172 RepID=A0AAV6UDT4_9ARAC|nr:hypothetical protein JTE90_024178 [Oedothorax gibbosus]
MFRALAYSSVVKFGILLELNFGPRLLAVGRKRIIQAMTLVIFVKLDILFNNSPITESISVLFADTTVRRFSDSTAPSSGLTDDLGQYSCGNFNQSGPSQNLVSDNLLAP